MIKLLGILAMLLGGGLFYFLFFKVAPQLSSLLPANEYRAILKVVIYIIIGWGGGIIIPSIIFILGLALFLQGIANLLKKFNL